MVGQPGRDGKPGENGAKGDRGEDGVVTTVIYENATQPTESRIADDLLICIEVRMTFDKVVPEECDFNTSTIVRALAGQLDVQQDMIEDMVISTVRIDDKRKMTVKFKTNKLVTRRIQEKQNLLKEEDRLHLPFEQCQAQETLSP